MPLGWQRQEYHTLQNQKGFSLCCVRENGLRCTIYRLTTMEVLKTMLQQRGISTDVVEPIETEFPAITSKIGNVVVYMSNRARISNKDIDDVIALTEKNGGTLSIVVVPIPPSPTILKVLGQYSDKIQLFHVGQLQFDITTHRKVSPHRILNAEEKAEYIKFYNITDPELQCMKISSQDIMAKWIGAKPGDIVEILRKSETAGTSKVYRVCVADPDL